MMNIPRATYRLQFREGMDFGRACALVPYLGRLGISHLYASPIFAAPKGSTHGYDVADHNVIDPSLGGHEGFDRLSAALKREGLGLLLDIVPNHMAASLENPWWRSVVERGEKSPYARHFDIDWREPLTLPILGKTFEAALADGEIGLAADAEAGAIALAYFDQRLPLAPWTYAQALEGINGPLAEQVRRAAENPSSEAMHDALRTLLADEAACATLDAASRTPTQLAALHEAQPWRLTFWKEARHHLSYRRFFEVTGLVGVRVEDPAVFADVHRLTLELVRCGQVDGLRIDHVDGLADPKAYLTQLRDAVGPDVFVVVEKILGEGELLPADWPVEGTTGYEFAAAMPELFVDAGGLDELSTGFDALCGTPFDLAAARRKAKTLMVTENFETELKGLVSLASLLTGEDTGALREGIAGLITAFPVYRTYGDAEGMPSIDRERLEKAAAEARQNLGETAKAALDAVLRLLLDGEDGAEFRARFQQLTGPATAKSVEDTLFYRANQLIAVNEVGGDPGQGVGSVERFHAAMQVRRETQRHGLNATATHDTKRGEDARARLYALSEAPRTWIDGVSRWREAASSKVETLPGGPAPEPETEWLLYQALAGIWPMQPGVPASRELAALAQRFETYIEKALREAKLRSGWGDPDKEYEAAVKAYVAALLDPGNGAFLQNFAATLAPFAEAGRRNSLCQTLVKLTAPGVPDIYQGTEGWDLSLVDPDNRRPVDFNDLAHRLEAGADRPDDEKLALIAGVLKLRAAEPKLFAEGSYEPVRTTGVGKNRIAAFLREHEGKALLTVVSRLAMEAGPGSPRATLAVEANSRWECVESGRHFDAADGSLAVAVLLGPKPYALLRRTG